MQVALEDSLVTMSTILSSRFVAGIRPEVEKVERQLNNFSDTLDQWVQVGCNPSGCSRGLHTSCPSSPDELVYTCNARHGTCQFAGLYPV